MDCIDDIRSHESNLNFSDGGLNSVKGILSKQEIKDQLCECLNNVAAKNRGEDVEFEQNGVSLFLELVFSRMTVDWENPIIRYNTYPIVVDEQTKLVKIHFLFQMLGIGQVFVADRGQLQGKLSLESFLNLRYTEQTFL